jgi:hypothetical protein
MNRYELIHQDSAGFHTYHIKSEEDLKFAFDNLPGVRDRLAIKLGIEFDSDRGDVIHLYAEDDAIEIDWNFIHNHNQ